MRSFAILLSLCLTMLASPMIQASEYAVGDTLKPISLQDQHEAAVVLDTSAKYLLFGRSMKGGEIIKTALEGRDNQALQQAGIFYLADISGMPSLIAKFVAIPQMRDLTFSIALDKEGEISKLLPAAKDAASLISLDQLTITKLQYFDDAEALKQALKDAGLQD